MPGSTSSTTTASSAAASTASTSAASTSAAASTTTAGTTTTVSAAAATTTTTTPATSPATTPTPSAATAATATAPSSSTHALAPLALARATATPTSSTSSTTASSTSATTAASAPTATASAASASTAATDTSTPATTPTATPTPSAASTATSATPASSTRALAPFALARAASPARGRRRTDRLKTNKVAGGAGRKGNSRAGEGAGATGDSAGAAGGDLRGGNSGGVQTGGGNPKAARFTNEDLLDAMDMLVSDVAMLVSDVDMLVSAKFRPQGQAQRASSPAAVTAHGCPPAAPPSPPFMTLPNPFARNAKRNVPASIKQLKHVAALLPLSLNPLHDFLHLPPSPPTPLPPKFARKAKRNVPAAIEQLKPMAALLRSCPYRACLPSSPPSPLSPHLSTPLAFARKSKRNVPAALQQLKNMAALLPPLPPAPFFPFPSSPAPPLPPSASSSPSSQLSTSTAETGLGHLEQEGGMGGGGGGQVGGAVAGEGGGAAAGGGADAGQEGRGTAEGGAVQEGRVAAGDEAVQESSLLRGIADADAAWRSDALRVLKEDDEAAVQAGGVTAEAGAVQAGTQATAEGGVVQESSLSQGIADADAAWRADALRALKEDDEGDERDEGDEGDEEYEEEEESEEEIEEEEEGAERGERGMGQEERVSLGSRRGEESEGKGGDEGVSEEEVVVASDAAFLLAVMAATGFAGEEVYPRNETLALHFLRLAAETGSMQAMAALASRFLYGRGVPTDCEASLAYYRSTAADLSAAAEASGDQQLPKDPVRLRDWFRDGGFQPQAFDDDHAEQVEFEQDLAERGVPESLRLMGFRHLIGQGIPRNPQEALRHFQLAAAAGDDVAAFNLGYMHMTGAGGAVPKNFTAARKYFLQAASGRNKLAAAQNGLGVLHQNGWGVKQDLILARDFFMKAAERNDSDALSNLGYIHFDGLGVPANATTAVGYFERAMDAGQWSAPYTLARILDGSLVSASAAYSAAVAAAGGAADSGAATVPRNCSRAAKLYGIFVSERIGWAAELKEAAAAYEDGDWWSGLVRYGMVAEEGSKVAAENAAQMLMRSQGYSASDRYALALDHRMRVVHIRSSPAMVDAALITLLFMRHPLCCPSPLCNPPLPPASDRYSLALDHAMRAVHIGSAPAMVDAALLMLIHHLPSLLPLPPPPSLSTVDPHLSAQSIPALDPHHPAQSLPAVDQNSTTAQPVTSARDSLPCDPLSLLQRAADLHEPEALFHLAYLHIVGLDNSTAPGAMSFVSAIVSALSRAASTVMQSISAASQWWLDFEDYPFDDGRTHLPPRYRPRPFPSAMSSSTIVERDTISLPSPVPVDRFQCRRQASSLPCLAESRHLMGSAPSSPFLPLPPPSSPFLPLPPPSSPFLPLPPPSSPFLPLPPPSSPSSPSSPFLPPPPPSSPLIPPPHPPSSPLLPPPPPTSVSTTHASVLPASPAHSLLSRGCPESHPRLSQPSQQQPLPSLSALPIPTVLHSSVPQPVRFTPLLPHPKYYVPLCLNLSGSSLSFHPEGRACLCGSAVLRASVPQPLGFSPILPHPKGRARLCGSAS
ncbi:unnamed protein product [Closterium sp. NIES-64]|nr:unnamed protein product [Closterium sp. NIES-64]